MSSSSSLPTNYAPPQLPEPVPMRVTADGFEMRCVLLAADARGGRIKVADPASLPERFVLTSPSGAMGKVRFVAQYVDHDATSGLFQWLLVSATGRRGNLVSVLRGILGIKAQLKAKNDMIPEGRELLYDAVNQRVRMLKVPDPDSGQPGPVEQVLRGAALEGDTATQPPGSLVPDSDTRIGQGNTAPYAQVTSAPEAPDPGAFPQLPAYQPTDDAYPSLPAYTAPGEAPAPHQPLPASPPPPAFSDGFASLPSFETAESPPSGGQTPSLPGWDPADAAHGGNTMVGGNEYPGFEPVRQKKRTDPTIVAAPPTLDPEPSFDPKRTAAWGARPPEGRAVLEDLASAMESIPGEPAPLVVATGPPPASERAFPPNPAGQRASSSSDRLQVAGERRQYLEPPAAATDPAPAAVSPVEEPHPPEMLQAASEPQPEALPAPEQVPAPAAEAPAPPDSELKKKKAVRHRIRLDDIATEDDELEQAGFLMPPGGGPRSRTATPRPEEGMRMPSSGDFGDLRERLARRAKKASNWRNKRADDPAEGPLLGRRPRPRHTDTNPAAGMDVPFTGGPRSKSPHERTDPSLDGPVFETKGLRATFDLDGNTHLCEWRFVGHTRAGFVTADIAYEPDLGATCNATLPGEPVVDGAIVLRAPIRHVEQRHDGAYMVHLHLRNKDAQVPREYRRIVQFWAMKKRGT